MSLQRPYAVHYSAMTEANEEAVDLEGAEPPNVFHTYFEKPSKTSDPGDDGGLELFPDMAELLEDEEGPTSDELISRTLHQLARDGNNTVLAALMSRLGDQAPARLNQLDGDRLAPLHYAARYAHPAVITALLQAGASVNILGQDDLTPLHCAARYRKSIKSAQSRKASHVSPPRELPPEDAEEEEEEKDEEDEGEEEEEEKDPVEDNLLNHDKNQLTLSSVASLTVSLGDAAKFGRPGEDSVVRLLVMNGAAVNAVDVYGLTPLHYACMRGNDVALRDLLACPSVDLECKDKQVMTPLCLAATFGYPDAVRQLLLAGAELMVRDEEYQTALHKSAEEGHLEIVQLLLEACHRRGNSSLVMKLLAARDSERKTALFMAVANGHLETSRRLLREGSNPNATRDNLATPLHAAASAGSGDLVDLLVSHGARVDSVDNYNQTPLHRAASHNMVDAVKALLRHSANIERRDRYSYTPLLVAVSEGHTEAAEALLEAGASVQAVDKDEKTIVFWSAAEGNIETLKILMKIPQCLELLDTSDRYDNSPLHEAARRGYVYTVSALLDAGSCIDNKNEDEETALHIAAEEGKTKVVRELVKRYRYLINDENEDSDTPLHLASLKGHSGVVKVLLEAGADVEARNTALWTPLDCASSAGHTDCCLLLLDYGSPLDPVDKRRTTPLQLAGAGGHVEVVQILLQKGASLAACDASGRNALELAIAAGRKEVVMAMLRSDQWQAALRHCRVGLRGRRITPFRMLVRRFPEAAELVLDKCTTANGMDAEHADFGIKFNFEFLDDSYQLSGGEDSESVGVSFAPQSAFDDTGNLLGDATLYTSDMRGLKNNHPLMLMVKHRRPNLLGHPVSVALVKHKWMNSGRYLYYFNLLVYLVFLTFLTGYILNAPDWASVRVALGNTTGYTCQTAEAALNIQRSTFEVAGHWVVLAMAIFNILRELFQLYQARLNYLGVENLLEWVCYVSAVLLVWNFSSCIIREDWQWQTGTVAIFLAWLNLLLFIRKFPYFGIYVVMFTDVFATFSKFFIVFFFFIISFALSFYTVLKNQRPFANPSGSILKTSVMMIGEFEYDSIFNDEDNPLPYPNVTWPLFVCFLILMSIIIMNLLVGLAVDDIKAVQEQAVLKRLGMQTQLVLDVETILPDFLRRLSASPYKIVHPNARHSPFSRLFGDSKVLQSFQFLSASEEMSETERLSQSVADLTTQVEELRAQNARTHAMLTSLVTFLRASKEGEDGEERAELLPRQVSEPA